MAWPTTLAAYPDLRHLERLRIDQNQLTAGGLAALQAAGVPVESENQYSEGAVRDHESCSRATANEGPAFVVPPSGGAGGKTA
jgi:hypothetical protein